MSPSAFDTNPAMTIQLEAICRTLPDKIEFLPGIRRAPKRLTQLSLAQKRLALKNALRYIPENWHEPLAPEFLAELEATGRIYGYRFRPPGEIYGKPIGEYKGNCIEGRAFQVMIDNNLSFQVALYPYELVTYGETGQVCQNWMQYRLIKRYLEVLTRDQTLAMLSGHPLGLFASSPAAPRVIITNGLMVGMYDHPDAWNIAAALGVTNYGQMTAGGWMYIGPQGIVHGTYSTLLNAGRVILGIPPQGDLSGVLFVSSGLGGMSGAQGKAVEIAGGVCVIAEVDKSRIDTRFEQGWIGKVANTPQDAFSLANRYLTQKQPMSIAFHGNILDLLAYAATEQIKIDLLSDQTSCHVVYEGGYCPQGLTFDQRTELLTANPAEFRQRVNTSLKLHFQLVQTLSAQGTFFFDYGNSFLKAVFDAGVIEVCQNKRDPLDGFIYPSYVENLMGPLLFDFGYGPFRWVCLSGNPEDLRRTDQAAMSCINPDRRFQDRDNYNWIQDAEKNRLVVGTQARILYQDALGRMTIALKFNELVRSGEVGPIMLGRDHHDTGGTDSPFRETANIKDGSNITADMAIQCFAGNAARGMSLVALHNGGGVGVGKAINGGFGLVLDGSQEKDEIIKSAMLWDVMVGVARRAWAGNENALQTALDYNQQQSASNHITLPFRADAQLIEALIK